MSQNIENIFKESLQQHEVPYDPKAWDALSSRLDALQPTVIKKPFNPWAAIIITVGLVGTASLFYFTSNQKSTDEKIVQSIDETKKSDSKNEDVTPSALDINVTSNDNAPIVNTETKKETKEKTAVTNVASKNVNKSTSLNLDLPVKEADYLSDKSTDILPPTQRYQAPPSAPVSSSLNTDIAKIDNTCQYMDRKINNTSDVRLTIEYPSGTQVYIQPKTAKSIEFSEAGKYKVFNSVGKENNFMVYENKTVDFTIDTENAFKNGLPTTEVKLNNSSLSGEWSSSFGNQNYSGNKAEFHFFKKGNYAVSVTSTNEKGCASASAKTVTIDNDYKLLATSGFKPQDLDPRNNTFMPRALTERNTAFTLMILDPKDGGLVYQTSDATAGWNGIDNRTGKPALHGSNYIWKVSLKNPLPGEPKDYRDIVTIIIE